MYKFVFHLVIILAGDEDRDKEKNTRKEKESKKNRRGIK